MNQTPTRHLGNFKPRCPSVCQSLLSRSLGWLWAILLLLPLSTIAGGGSDGGGNIAVPKFISQGNLLYDQLNVNPKLANVILGFDILSFKTSLQTDVVCAPPNLLDFMLTQNARAYFFKAPNIVKKPKNFALSQTQPTIYIDCPFWEQTPTAQLTLEHKINIFHEYLRVLDIEGHPGDAHPYMVSQKLPQVPSVSFDAEIMCKDFYANAFPQIKTLYQQYLQCYAKAQDRLRLTLDNQNAKTSIKLEAQSLLESELRDSHKAIFKLLQNKNYFQANGLADYNYFEDSIEPLILDYLNSTRAMGHDWSKFHTGLLGCVGFSPLDNLTWQNKLPRQVQDFINWPRNQLDFQHVLCIDLKRSDTYQMELCTLTDESHYFNTSDNGEAHPIRYCTRAPLQNIPNAEQITEADGFYEVYGNHETFFSGDEDCRDWGTFAQRSNTTVRYKAPSLTMQEWLYKVYLRQWDRKIDKCLLGNN